MNWTIVTIILAAGLIIWEIEAAVAAVCQQLRAVANQLAALTEFARREDEIREAQERVVRRARIREEMIMEGLPVP